MSGSLSRNGSFTWSRSLSSRDSQSESANRKDNWYRSEGTTVFGKSSSSELIFTGKKRVATSPWAGHLID